MGNKRSLSAIRKNAAAKKKYLQLEDPQYNGSDLSPNEEITSTREGRGMQIKKPTIKLTENAEDLLASDIDEVTKKHDDDFVPDVAEIDPSSSDDSDTPTILEVSRQKKGSKIETGIFITVSVILYLCDFSRACAFRSIGSFARFKTCHIAN